MMNGRMQTTTHLCRVVATMVIRFMLFLLLFFNTKHVVYFVSGSDSTDGVDLPTCPICQDYDPLKCQVRMMFLLLHRQRDNEEKQVHDDDDDDDDDDIQCHVDDDWALIHCQESYLVCVPNLIVPNVGVIPFEASQQHVVTIRQRIPLPISLEIAHVSRQTHLKYYKNSKSSSPSSSSLSSSSSYVLCVDQSDMCPFWKYQGQCTNEEYQSYMERECPVTCNVCEDDVYKSRAFFKYLLELKDIFDDDNVSSSTATITVVERRRRVLQHLLDTFKIRTDDASVNWAWQLHDVLMNDDIIPAPLLKLYPSVPIPSLKKGNSDTTGNRHRRRRRRPDVSRNEFQLLAKLYGINDIITNELLEFCKKDGNTNNQAQEEEEEQQQLLQDQLDFILDDMFIQYRSRGYIVSMMTSRSEEYNFDEYVIRTIQLNIGFSIPNKYALQRIRDIEQQNCKQEYPDCGGKIIEMGAGTGYWANLLDHQQGIDVIAYDLYPPKSKDAGSSSGGSGSGNGNRTDENEFFDVSYYDKMQQGSCSDIFQQSHNCPNPFVTINMAQ